MFEDTLLQSLYKNLERQKELLNTLHSLQAEYHPRKNKHHEDHLQWMKNTESSPYFFASHDIDLPKNLHKQGSIYIELSQLCPQSSRFDFQKKAEFALLEAARFWFYQGNYDVLETLGDLYTEMNEFSDAVSAYEGLVEAARKWKSGLHTEYLINGTQEIITRVENKINEIKSNHLVHLGFQD